MTALYWAWKNYDKLGNPDYIGLMHYRRYFNLPDYSDETIHSLIQDTDIVCQPLKKFSFITRQQFENLTDYVNLCFRNLKPILALAAEIPEYKKSVDDFFVGTEMFFSNMFIMKRELFFEYCEFR